MYKIFWRGRLLILNLASIVLCNGSRMIQFLQESDEMEEEGTMGGKLNSKEIPDFPYQPRSLNSPFWKRENLRLFNLSGLINSRGLTGI